MADIAAANVTYTIKNLRRLGNSRTSNRVQLQFGNGVLTYGAGGIPLVGGKMGCANSVESVNVVSRGLVGYSWMYNPATGKLVGWQSSAAGSAEAELSTVAIAAQTLEVEVIGW